MKLPMLTNTELLTELARVSTAAVERRLVAPLAALLDDYHQRCSVADSHRPFMLIFEDIRHELTVRGYFTAEQFLTVVDALMPEGSECAEVVLAA